MTVRATEIKNVSNRIIVLPTEVGSIELAPGQTVRNVRLEERTLTEQEGDLKARVQLRD